MNRQFWQILSGLKCRHLLFLKMHQFKQNNPRRFENNLNRRLSEQQLKSKFVSVRNKVKGAWWVQKKVKEQGRNWFIFVLIENLEDKGKHWFLYLKQFVLGILKTVGGSRIYSAYTSILDSNLSNICRSFPVYSGLFLSTLSKHTILEAVLLYSKLPTRFYSTRSCSMIYLKLIFSTRRCPDLHDDVDDVLFYSKWLSVSTQICPIS